MEKIEIVVSHTVGQKEVYATAKVGDKVLQAVAKCNDTDVFDLRFGGELAAARVEQKVGKYLTKVIEQRKKNVIRQMKELRKHLDHLDKWQEDTNLELEHAELKEEMMSNHPELFV